MEEFPCTRMREGAPREESMLIPRRFAGLSLPRKRCTVAPPPPRMGSHFAVMVSPHAIRICRVAKVSPGMESTRLPPRALSWALYDLSQETHASGLSQ